MLWKKTIRDMYKNKMAYMACVFVVAIGLLSYTALSTAKDNLFVAKDTFYKQHAFADGFIELVAMPSEKLEALYDISEINQISGRLVKDVRVHMPNTNDNVFLRLISLQQMKNKNLNDVHILTGSLPIKNHRQILLADKFYQANAFAIGQPITVIIEGKQVELTVSGSGQSPEYIYALKNLQSLTPDPKTFEVAYMPYEDMSMLFNQAATVNQIAFTLKPGTTFQDVEQKLKSALKPYGITSLYAAKDQMSNAMLTQELQQLEKMVVSIPIFFLTIAAIILYIMLKRLVESQRGQIGTMKAFGYRDTEIVWHYLSYGLIIGVVGGMIGGGLGNLFSSYLVTLYQSYFSLPNLQPQFTLKYFMIGMMMAISFSTIASFQGVRGILKLQPAEAMYPPVPSFEKGGLLERFPILWNLFTMQGHMAIRNMIRNKSRSFFTYIGVVMTFSMMASFFSLEKSAEIMVLDQFTKVQTQDIKLNFVEPMPLQTTVRELQHLNGVQQVEPLVEIPTTLKWLNYQADIQLLGIAENSTMYNIFDKQNHRITLPSSGIVLSEHIASKLHVQVGDVVYMESPYAKDEKIYMKIEKVIPQYLGANAYMNQQALLHLLRQGDIATAMLITASNEATAELKTLYKSSNAISMIEIRQEMIKKYNDYMQLTASTLSVMAIIAIITGFAIVYNASIISLAERQRELASLRVLGLTEKEVMSVIAVEQWLIGIAGMVSGIPVAILLNTMLSKSMSSDLFTLPALTSMTAIVQACVGTVLALVISERAIFYKVKRLDLVSVLKERD